MIRLPDKDPDESVVIEFDFSNELPAVDSATIVVTSASDPSPISILTGAEQIVGAKVLQRVGAGLDRSDYKIKCTAVRTNDIRVLTSVLPVRAA